MFDLMNEMSELVYVSDIDTYELLFINNAGENSFKVEPLNGQKCYKALQGKDSPCDFCTNHLLTADSFYTWEITNEISGFHYLLKDRLIDWNGKLCRLEIAFDTTAQERQKTALKKTAQTNAAMIDCLKILYENDDTDKALNEILGLFGELLQAERAYIFDIEGDALHMAYEWCSKGISQQRNVSQWIDISKIKRWRDAFECHKSIIVTDVEALAEAEPVEYELLKQREVERLVVVPIELDGALAGFLGVSNPPIERLANISTSLDTLGYFTASYMQRQKDKNRLERLSYYDTLTGLLNRNAFNRDLQILSKAPEKSLGVAYLNVNGMKEMNNSYGHKYGDTMLRRVAQTVEVRAEGNSLYRIGGDEFVVLCSNIPELQFEGYVRDLKNTFTQNSSYPLAIGHRWSDSCDRIDDIVLDASDRMYADKKSYYYRQASPKRYRHENDDILNLTKSGILQDMLKNNRFIVYIQPKVSVSDRQIIGGEALVRLLSPEGELIAPDRFIPLLEESRLISHVDFFVFECICSKINDWLERGKNVLPISVNFSRYTLTEKQFAGRLAQIWGHFKIPQRLVEIEFTESMSEEENDAFLEVAENIRKLGFTIAIDDFGIKHANVSLFTQLKFDVLKIDKIIISKLQEDVTSQLVLQSISDICRGMGIQLIVEGVETEEQFAVLNKINCEGAQGFLFDKPMPIEEFEQKYISSK